MRAVFSVTFRSGKRDVPQGGKLMQLKQVTITNYTPISDITLEVRRHLVLVGANDSGKTSILTCLDLLLSATTPMLYSHFQAWHFRDATKPIIISVDINNLDDKIQIAFGINNNRISEIKLTLSAFLDESQMLTIKREVLYNNTTKPVADSQLTGIGWELFDAGEVPCTASQYKTVLSGVMESTNLRQHGLSSLTQSFREQIEASPFLENLRERLAEKLIKTMPGNLNKDAVHLVPKDDIGTQVLGNIRVQVKRQNKSPHMIDCLDGMRSLYAVAIYDVLSRDASVVGIDEPETHLHPTIQRSLARVLQEEFNQKIIATHSADIVGAFSPEHVAVVQPNGQVVQPARGFLGEDERIIARWWVHGRLEPLTARRIVAVEGISDRIILESAAEVTGRNLDRLGIALIEANGSGDMWPIYKLFGPKGFRIPISLLIDSDAVQHTSVRLGIPKNEFTQNSIYVSKRDLEDEYTRAIGANTLWNALRESKLFAHSELRGGGKTEQAVAAFCRKNSSNKVRAALVVSSLLNEELAIAIESVNSLLNAIELPR